MSENDSEVRPELLLFLSIDLAGSTAYKQRPVPHAGSKPWLRHFQDFHESFPTLLERECGREAVKPPNVWKRVGDEILFTVVLMSPEDLEIHLKAFRQALRYYRTLLHDQGTPLDVKAAAWLAGVPVTNAKFTVSMIDAEGQMVHLVDYLGPSIDIGFRVASTSSPRKFVLSVEIAYVLSTLANDSGLKVHFQSGTQFKGVFRGAAYPALWLDTYERDDENEEMLAEKVTGNHPEECVWATLLNYTKFYIGEHHDNSFFLPFFTGDKRFPMPDHYDQAKKIAAEEFKDRRDPELNIDAPESGSENVN